jgi:hypothetical protein
VANGTRGYRRPPVRIGVGERVVQLVSAAAAVALAILLAAQRAWPFDVARPKLPARPSRALEATERELQRTTRNLEVVTKDRDEAVALVKQLRGDSA